MRNFIKAVIACLAFAPIAIMSPAFAQDVPSYAVAPVAAPADEQIQGRVLSFDGGYNLLVADVRGFNDNVQLRQGTIINPTGLTLAPGMSVTISGYNAGNVLEANEIDTPYQSYGGYYGYAGRPWNYYVGPAFGIGFFFGAGVFNNWYHPYWRGGYYGGGIYRGGYYNHGYVRGPAYVGGRSVYRVAPRAEVHTAPAYRGGGGGHHR